MAVSNLLIKQTYVADGVVDTFAIPYQFIPQQASNHTRVYLIDADDVETLQVEGALQDYTLDPVYDPVTNPNGPANIIFNTPPAAPLKVLVIRNVPLQQVVSFLGTGPIPAKSLERALDLIVMMVQQIDDQAQRALTLSQSAATDGAIPTPVASSVLATNSLGDALEWIPLASLAGTPAGGAIGAALIKLSATDYDVAWEDFVYDGIAQLTGGQFTSAGLKDTLDKVIRITYTPPVISLSGSSNVLREKGTSVSNITLTAAIQKKSNAIGEVRFYQNPSTLLDTQSSGGAIPNGGNSTYNFAGPFSDNVTFRAAVDDVLAGGNGPTTVQATTSYSFVYPYYFGCGATGKGGAAIRSDLTTSVINQNNNLTQTFNYTNGQTAYHAFPATYGDLNQIFDVNNFDVTSGWTKSTKSITGLNGTPVNYTVYEKNAVFSGSGSTTFRFVR